MSNGDKIDDKLHLFRFLDLLSNSDASSRVMMLDEDKLLVYLRTRSLPLQQPPTAPQFLWRATA
jgi:hypothetical protein